MPRRQFIDKKNATTFALVHRAQNDPLINDADAPDMVFAEISGPSTQQQYPQTRSKKTKERGDLEEEFGMNFKANEGQAAEHGIYYDDTAYDYMQHMKDLGTGGGEVTWVEAPGVKQQQGKGKGKQTLEDAIRNLDLDTQSEGGVSMASSRSLLPDDALGSEFVKRTTYQDQQAIPDALAGFQPNMDPRLREVLEALEDEAYVDDEDDIFAELADGGEVDEDEWEDTLYADQDDEGWESDHTIRAADDTTTDDLPPLTSDLPPSDTAAPPPADPTEGAWLAEYSKFKKASKAGAAPSEVQSAAHTGLSSLASTRHKKRKGARTSTTNYSMTSSALARTDTQTLLDDRFDKLLDKYESLDDIDEEGAYDDESMVSGMTGRSNVSRMSYLSKAPSEMSRASGISTYSRATDSEAPQLVRGDFDSIMDGFLGGHAKVGRKGYVKKGVGRDQNGMMQLDEIRNGLGPARFKNGKKTGKA